MKLLFTTGTTPGRARKTTVRINNSSIGMPAEIYDRFNVNGETFVNMSDINGSLYMLFPSGKRRLYRKVTKISEVTAFFNIPAPMKPKMKKYRGEYLYNLDTVKYDKETDLYYLKLIRL